MQKSPLKRLPENPYQKVLPSTKFATQFDLLSIWFTTHFTTQFDILHSMIGVEHPLKICRVLVLYNRLENGEAYNVPGEFPVGHAEEHPFKRLPGVLSKKRSRQRKLLHNMFTTHFDLRHNLIYYTVWFTSQFDRSTAPNQNIYGEAYNVPGELPVGHAEEDWEHAQRQQPPEPDSPVRLSDQDTHYNSGL